MRIVESSKRRNVERPSRRLPLSAAALLLTLTFPISSTQGQGWENGPLGPIIFKPVPQHQIHIRIDFDDEDVRIQVDGDLDDEELRREVERVEQQLRDQMERQIIQQRIRDLEIEVANQPLFIPPGTDPLPSDEELAQVGINEDLLRLVARLDDSEYEIRSRAMEAIINFPAENAQLYALLVGHGALAQPLSAEQHFRIMAALRQRVLHAPRGALGIRMDPRESHVEVIDLLPDLPAREALRVGDRITAIDGRELNHPGQLTTTIQARAPGEVVVLTVQRPQRDAGRNMFDEEGRPVVETLEIPVTLGSADLLQDPLTGQSATNRQVEENRRREVAAMERRFSREPVRIAIAGELPAPPRAQPTQLSMRVEQHPAIREVRLMQAGNLPRDPDFVRFRLNSLRRQYEHPALSEDDREFLGQVIERFIELTSDF